MCVCSVGGQQQPVPVNAGFTPHARLPLSTTAQLPSGVLPAGAPKGMPPPSVGPMHHMPLVPGSGGPRPVGAIPPRPPGTQQMPTAGPPVSIRAHIFKTYQKNFTTIFYLRRIFGKYLSKALILN